MQLRKKYAKFPNILMLIRSIEALSNELILHVSGIKAKFNKDFNFFFGLIAKTSGLEIPTETIEHFCGNSYAMTSLCILFLLE